MFITEKALSTVTVATGKNVRSMPKSLMSKPMDMKHSFLFLQSFQQAV